jgi:iron complex outermembrane recepter protein
MKIVLEICKNMDEFPIRECPESYKCDLRPQGQAFRMIREEGQLMATSNLKNYLLSFASVTALAFASTAAMAQDAEPADEDEEMEEVVVTGIRASIRSAIEKKRTNTSIVEALSAEDIGKLPDQSIAESIARLPGIAAQRLDGRANVITVRGLAPDFTTALLNGREQVTANNNRGVEFDQYPAELLSGVTIYKTPDASLTGQAIGGTIDLQTVRPLAYGKQAMAVGGRIEYNDLGALNSDVSATGYRGNFSYIDQFVDDTIGIAIGYARLVSPTQEERWNAWGYPDSGDGNLVIGGAKPFVKSNKLTRDGLMGVLEYKPDDTFSTVIDLYYSKFADEQRLRGIELPLQWSAAQLQAERTASNGLITDGSFAGVKGVIRNDVSTRDAKTFSGGWNMAYQVDENWSVEADLSYTKVTRTDVALESYAGTGRGGGNESGATDTIGFSLTDNGSAVFSPGLDYSDYNLIQLGGPQGWGNPIGDGTWSSQDGFINTPTTEDELSAIRLSAERQMQNDFISSIEFGMRYSKRQKTLDDTGTFLTLKQYPDTLVVPEQYRVDPVSLDFIGMGNMIAYDSLAFYNDGNYIETDATAFDLSRITNDYDISEKVLNLYVQANVDTEWGDTPVVGNIGVQAVYTDQSANGFATRIENGVIEVNPNTGGDKYWEFLPSMNLSFDVAENTKIRLGAARVLARARMQDMNASLSFGFNAANVDNNVTDATLDQSPWSGGGGNPQLRPWISDQIDLSIEHYFGDGGYVAIAGFYKHLETYIFNNRIEYDFTGIDVPFSPATFRGLISTPTNGNGGQIYGVELSGSLTGAMLAEELTGFGLTFSASLTDSKVRETDVSDPIPLPGLSKTVINSTLYYERYGFSARISARHRSDFLGEVSGLSLANTTVSIAAETVFDAQLGFDFTEYGADGLTLLLQVNNLTNEPFTTFQNADRRQVRDFQNYGRTFFMGFNYRF